MRGLPELARYSVVVGYVQYLAPQGEVLDLGCGEGLLQARLGCSNYARYVGVDVSRAAIDVASARADERTRFVSEDVERFQPEGLFDVIVLNEVLYYFSDPLQVLQRYARFLKPGGAFVVSMFETEETRANWRYLERDLAFIDQTRSSNGSSGFAWDCRVARPVAASATAI